MKRDRLFDVAPRVRRVSTTMALVPWPSGACPLCGCALSSVTVDEAVLFRHAGHGATQRTSVDFCAGCGWRVVSQVQEVRPDA